MKNYRITTVVFSVVFLLAVSIKAHFLVLRPSIDTITSETNPSISLDILFTHPAETVPVMNLDTPKRFGVLVHDKHTNLLPTLKTHNLDGAKKYSSTYKVTAPGDYIFYIEPAPYWEEAEKKYIVHYTKVVVSAYGEESGWDNLVGFPVEIAPLTRPYGVWAGNSFRGVVLHKGKPAGNVVVEIERINKTPCKYPSETLITQVVKTDANGVFVYTIPASGWWGFNALIDDENGITKKDGTTATLEQGGLIWVYAHKTEGNL